MGCSRRDDCKYVNKICKDNVPATESPTAFPATESPTLRPCDEILLQNNCESKTYCKWSSGSCWAKEAVVPTGAPSQAPTASPTNAPDEKGEDSVIRCADYDNNKDVCQNEANLVGVCTWNPNPPTTKLQCVPVDTKLYCNEYHGD